MKTNFDKLLKALYALSPTGLATYLSQWLGLFRNAGLAHRDFAPKTENLALGISTIAVLALYVWLHGKSSKILGWTFSLLFTVGFLGSLAGCIALDHFLLDQKQAELVEKTIAIWRWTYFSLLISTSLSVVVFMLWLLSFQRGEKNTNKTNSADS